MACVAWILLIQCRLTGRGAAGVWAGRADRTRRLTSLPENLAFLKDVPLWPLAALGLFAFLLGLLLGRLGKESRARRSITTDTGTYVDLEVYRETQKVRARLEQENQVFTEFFQMLTDFTKEMDGRLDNAVLPNRLLEIVEKIFLPSQVLVFLADDNKPGSLILTRSKGLATNRPARMEIRTGEGKIGLVAQTRTTMDQEDFVRELRSGEANLDAPGHFQFKVDLCAPMLGNTQQTMGVISVGGISRHPKFEKRLLSMIADLGAVALVNRDLMDEHQRDANSDGLTGLFNKRYLRNRLGEEIHKAEREHYPVSIFIFDLDHFKKLNDTYGHLIGDKVLKETAQFVKKTLQRKTDVAARWGGEEFLIILPETAKDGAWRAAEKIRMALAGHPFQDEDGSPVGPVTLSGGIATFPDDGRQQSELVGAADEALYQAKKAGRNRVIRATPKFLSADRDEPALGEGGRPDAGTGIA